MPSYFPGKTSHAKGSTAPNGNSLIASPERDGHSPGIIRRATSPAPDKFLEIWEKGKVLAHKKFLETPIEARQSVT